MHYLLPNDECPQVRHGMFQYKLADFTFWLVEYSSGYGPLDAPRTGVWSAFGSGNVIAHIFVETSQTIYRILILLPACT